MKIKNYKQLWTIIAKEMSQELGFLYTPNVVENKWRVLERTYKKFLENKNATGRGRKDFKFFEQMDRILGKKRNINPILTLSTATIHEPEVKDSVNELKDSVIELKDSVNELKDSEIESVIINTEDKVEGEYIKRKRKTQRKTMQEKCYEERKIYNEKRLKLTEKKLNEIQKIREALEEHNKILREKNI